MFTRTVGPFNRHYIVDQIGKGLPTILWFVFYVIGLTLSFAGSAVATSLLSAIYRELGQEAPESGTAHRALMGAR